MSRYRAIVVPDATVLQQEQHIAVTRIIDLDGRETLPEERETRWVTYDSNLYDTHQEACDAARRINEQLLQEERERQASSR